MKNKSGSVENSVNPTGNIDGIYHQTLTGWYCIGPEDEALCLTLEVNGKPTLTTLTDMPRVDVESHFGYAGKSGFCFDLSELDVDETVKLSIRHDDTGYNFNDSVWEYSSGIAIYYDVLKELFYPEYYRCKYDLCHLSNDEAYQEFIKEGIYVGKDPNPWFSNEHYRKHYPHRLENGETPLLCYLSTEKELNEQASNLFDAAYYHETYPDLYDVQSLLSHYSVYGKNEGRVGVEARLPASIKKEFYDISEIEPAVVGAAESLDQIVRYPHITSATYLPKLIHQKLGDDIQALICVPFISHGGADLISTCLFRAYQNALGKDKVAMLVTDRAVIDVPEWLDDDSLIICLDDECSYIDDEERLTALHIAIGFLAPEKIVNVNSKVAWKMFERYGVQLSTVVDLYACLFCFDYDAERNRVGYITNHIPSTLKYLKAVYCDNETIIREVVELYGLSSKDASKLHTVYIPTELPEKIFDMNDISKRDTFLWAGRLSLQKRPDILVDIAAAMPNQKFDVYGPPGNCQFSRKIIDGMYENIRYRGVYNTFDEIEFDQYLAFLNTSEWEGLPTVIIQMMAMGLPVVTTSVGGISELVNEENGWLVDDIENIDSFELVLRRVIVNPELSAEKAKAGAATIAKKHLWQHYYSRLESLGAFADHEDLYREAVIFPDRRKAA